MFLCPTNIAAFQFLPLALLYGMAMISGWAVTSEL
jgi:hypothetical protein